MDTVQLSIELPREVFSSIRQDPTGFMSEMRLVAAVKWYEMGTLSQSKAAEIAGLSRAEFIDALNRFRVSPFQYDSVEELVGEATTD
jgi:predicted HTH domain antitoxin